MSVICPDCGEPLATQQDLNDHRQHKYETEELSDGERE